MADQKRFSPEERRKIMEVGSRYAFSYIDQGFISIEDFSTAMIGRLGDKIRPWIKSLYSGIRNMPGYEHVNFTSVEEVYRFDVNTVERDIPENEQLEKIQEQCSNFADELFTLVCKRAMRTINTWMAHVLPNADEYPNTFTTFDILSVQFQSMGFDEIAPYLHDAIDGALSTAYESLSKQEKFFIEYSECYISMRTLTLEEVDKKIYDRFVDLLNDHWSNSKKIQKFEEKRSW